MPSNRATFADPWFSISPICHFFSAQFFHSPKPCQLFNCDIEERNNESVLINLLIQTWRLMWIKFSNTWRQFEYPLPPKNFVSCRVLFYFTSFFLLFRKQTVFFLYFFRPKTFSRHLTEWISFKNWRSNDNNSSFKLFHSATICSSRLRQKLLIIFIHNSRDKFPQYVHNMKRKPKTIYHYSEQCAARNSITITITLQM